MTKLDRLARSSRDVRDIPGELTERGVALQIGSTPHDPNDPVGRLLFNVLSSVAEFETDLIGGRTREAMARPGACRKRKGQRPAMSPEKDEAIYEVTLAGTKWAAAIARIHNTSRSSVYRAIEQHCRVLEDGVQ